MKTRLTIIAIALMLFLVSSAGAFEYKLGYDFGNPFDENNNYSPIHYPYGVNNYPSPGLLGEGGEKFDLEGLHFGMDGNMVHIALVNSFGLTATSSAWHQTYALGDIFFGFGDQRYSYSIDVPTGRLYAVDRWRGIPNLPGSYYGNMDIRNAVGGWDTMIGVEIGTVNHQYTMWQGLETNPLGTGNGDTWVMEFSFDRSLLNNMQGARTINFHNTLGCGNDVIDKSFSVVPEPSTFLFFALGIFGLGVAVKKY